MRTSDRMLDRSQSDLLATTAVFVGDLPLCAKVKAFSVPLSGCKGTRRLVITYASQFYFTVQNYWTL